LVLAGCTLHGAPPSDCKAGFVWLGKAKRCVRVCDADLDCDNPCRAGAGGEICEANACITGCRDGIPEITAIDGNGSPSRAGDLVTAPHALRNGLVISGRNFGGSRVFLGVTGAHDQVLAVASKSDTQVEACLPEGLAEGIYRLSVVTAARPPPRQAGQAGTCRPPSSAAATSLPLRPPGSSP
jgi:hypothetical protein